VFVASPSLPLQLSQTQRCEAEINGKKAVVVGDASGMARATATELETPMLNALTSAWTGAAIRAELTAWQVSGSASCGLEELDHVARGIFEKDLLPAGSGDDVVPKGDIGIA
jgi:hypothetical protein